MTDNARNRISAFLSQFVEMHEGDSPYPRSDVDFVSAIELLIEQDIFTKDELRRECAKGYSVIIPEYLFGRYADHG